MKNIRIIITICLIALIITGCSGIGNGAKRPNESAAESSGLNGTLGAEDSDGATGETRVFATAKGDIVIPANPKKIVSDYYLGEFLALGVKPAIASPYSLSNPFLADEIEGIESLNISSSETALEMIIEAQPDLIVTLSESDYDNFSKIAPTVYIPYGKYSDSELFYYIADMLGKRKEAEDYMTIFEADVLSVKDEIREIVGTRKVSFVEVWPGEVYVMGSHFARGGTILFDYWDLQAPDPVQQKMVIGDTQYEVISLELLPQYTGDIIFYGVLSGVDSGFVETSNVWKALPAVKNGLVKDYEQVAFMHSDPITLRAQLDFYTEYFRSLE